MFDYNKYQKEYHKEYSKTLKRYLIQLNPRNDIDKKIIEYLSKIENKNEYIKNLIIKDGGIK